MRALLLAAALLAATGAAARPTFLDAAPGESWVEHVDRMIRWNEENFDIDEEERAERRSSFEHQRYCAAPPGFARQVCERRRELFEARQGPFAPRK